MFFWVYKKKKNPQKNPTLEGVWNNPQGKRQGSWLWDRDLTISHLFYGALKFSIWMHPILIAIEFRACFSHIIYLFFWLCMFIFELNIQTVNNKMASS